MAARRKYRWEVWFREPHTVLRRGVDYHCSQSSMCQSIRNNASRLGVRVHLTDLGESITVEVVGEVQSTTEAPIAG